MGGDFSQHGFLSLRRNISYPVQHILKEEAFKQEAEHDVMGNPLTDLSYAGNILLSFVFKSPVPKFFSVFQSPNSAARSMNTQLCHSKVTNSVLGGPS